jgi:hypothetical protein
VLKKILWCLASLTRNYSALLPHSLHVSTFPNLSPTANTAAALPARVLAAGLPAPPPPRRRRCNPPSGETPRLSTLAAPTSGADHPGPAHHGASWSGSPWRRPKPAMNPGPRHARCHPRMRRLGNGGRRRPFQRSSARKKRWRMEHVCFSTPRAGCPPQPDRLTVAPPRAPLLPTSAAPTDLFLVIGVYYMRCAVVLSGRWRDEERIP